jgi:simple sugar transport system permease protein
VSRDLPPSTSLALLPGLRVHLGIVLALALVPIMAYVIGRTPFGFRVGMLGLNPEAAEVAGVDRARLITWLMTVSGGMAGLAGIVHVMGIARHLQTGLSPGFGFTAIVVALLGRNRAFGVLAGALFMAALAVGGQAMSFSENVPFGVVLLIQALFVVFLLVGDRLARR